MSGESEAVMQRSGVRIVDTFAEAFDMRAARVVITAQSLAWARTAAQSLTGFATSVIGCKIEAGIEAELLPEVTPDLRPGVSVLLFGFAIYCMLLMLLLSLPASYGFGRVARRPLASTACQARLTE